jgi:hypothetical protein
VVLQRARLLWAAEKERVNIVCHHHHHQDDAWRRGWQHPKEDASVWYIVPPKRWGVFFLFFCLKCSSHMFYFIEIRIRFKCLDQKRRKRRNENKANNANKEKKGNTTLLVLTVVPTVTQHLCRHIVACH